MLTVEEQIDALKPAYNEAHGITDFASDRYRGIRKRGEFWTIEDANDVWYKTPNLEHILQLMKSETS